MKRKLLILARIIVFFIAYIFIFGIFQYLGGSLSGVSLTEEIKMTSLQLFVINFSGFLGTVFVLYLFTRWVDKIPFVDIV